MIELRTLEPADLERVAAVFDAMFGSGRGRPRPGIVDFFSRTLFENPWADPELPSFVAEDDGGRIVGFITVGPRRMLLGRRPVRIAVCGNLAVLPECRKQMLGVRLQQRVLQGPQDATISDTASEIVRRVWLRLGGSTLPVSSLHWVRVFAPWGAALELVGRRVTRPGARRLATAAAAGLDRATPAAVLSRLEPPKPESGEVEPLDARSLLGALPHVTGRMALRPEYDEAYLRFLFDELARVPPARGRLVAGLVWRTGSRVAGWYAYHLRPGSRGEVLAVVAANDADTGLVLDHLIEHAHRHGTVALRGRLEPRLVEPIARRRCVTWYGWPALLHTADDELARAVLSGDALLTRLEGEWSGEQLG